jgi:hypothetical protein
VGFQPAGNRCSQRDAAAGTHLAKKEPEFILVNGFTAPMPTRSPIKRFAPWTCSYRPEAFFAKEKTESTNGVKKKKERRRKRALPEPHIT